MDYWKKWLEFGFVTREKNIKFLEAVTVTLWLFIWFLE